MTFEKRVTWIHKLYIPSDYKTQPSELTKIYKSRWAPVPVLETRDEYCGTVLNACLLDTDLSLYGLE